MIRASLGRLLLLAIPGVLAPFATGCVGRQVVVEARQPARVEIERPLELIVISEMARGRGTFRAGGRSWEARTGQAAVAAVEAQVMHHLATSDRYGMIDEATRTVVRREEIADLDPNAAGYRQALWETDPERVAILTATVWSRVEDTREVRERTVGLETRRGPDRRVVDRRRARVAEYARGPVGGLRVTFRLRSAADDEVLHEGTYDATRGDEGEELDLGPGDGSRAGADPRAVLVELAGRLAGRFVRDISPTTTELRLPVVEAGDVASRNLLVHGAATLAERRLFERLREGSYESEGAEAVERYHLGLALMAQGLALEATAFLEQAVELDPDPTYERALQEARAIVRARRAEQGPN